MHQSTWKLLSTRRMLPTSWKEPAWSDVLLLITVAIWMSESKLSSTCHECQNVMIEALTDLHVAGLLPQKSQMTTLITALPSLSNLISSSCPSLPLLHFLHIPLKISRTIHCWLFNLTLNSCCALMQRNHHFQIFVCYIKLVVLKPRWMK